MDCANCDRLARELREAREELAEWERQQPQAPGEPGAELIERTRRRFKTTEALSRYLLELIRLPGETVPRERLFRVRHDPDSRVSMKVMDVHMFKLRAALRPHGLAIHSREGVGYWIDAEDALRIRALIGDDTTKERP